MNDRSEELTRHRMNTIPPPNDSSTGGYLLPSSAPLADDAALDGIFQSLVASCTGLPGHLVRPRWQPVPANRPENTVDWAAVGVTDETPEPSAVVIHHPDGEGYDELQRQVTLTVAATFYGPNSRGFSGLLRDGLAIGQNREALYLAGMSLKMADVHMINTAEQVGPLWYKRQDVIFTIVRMIGRTYPVLNLLEAQGTVHSERLETAPDDSDWISGPLPPVP